MLSNNEPRGAFIAEHMSSDKWMIGLSTEQRAVLLLLERGGLTVEDVDYAIDGLGRTAPFDLLITQASLQAAVRIAAGR